MTPVSVEHIALDERGVARIAGSRVKVIHLVMHKTANGWTVEQLQAQFPHLTPAQVHAALAYYYDHQAELDAQIQASIREDEEAARLAGETPVVQRLRALGYLP